jgi:DNA-directed RNA polymerase sigma subunit (sigma70/sigma32)
MGEMIERHEAANDKARRALAMRREGKTFRELGAHFGVCIERARQICARAEHLEKGWTSAYIEALRHDP